MINHKTVIIIGGGASVKTLIAEGLWDKIQGYDIWSCNSVFKCMPYLPTAQFWVDSEFFRHEKDSLERLQVAGVELVTKEHMNIAGLKKQITQYGSSRLREDYHGKKSLQNNTIYYGRMGLCGMFALSVSIARSYDTIYLLGFDFGSNNISRIDTHWYQEEINKRCIFSAGAGHPEVYLNPELAGKVREEVSDFSVFASEPDINIYNVSLISNIECFQKISCEEFFKKIHAK